MKKLHVVLASIACLTVCGSASAATLASFTPASPFQNVTSNGTVGAGQSFQTIEAGTATELRLLLNAFDGAGSPATQFEISFYDTASGAPTTQLGSKLFSAPALSSTAAWYSFDFASLNLSLQADSLYAFAVDPAPSGGINFWGDQTGYPAGTAYFHSSVWSPLQTDLAFEVLGTAPVPLPAAAWLLLSGLGAIGVAARKRVPGAA